MSEDLSALAGATIVFDLDGTLVDTAPDLLGTLNSILEDEGLPVLALDEIRPMIGRGARAMMLRGFEAAGQTLPEARGDVLFDSFITRYDARIAEDSRPFPGVVEALDALAGAGARLAVCTNKRTHLSLSLLEALGLASRFAAIVGAEAVAAAKPSPVHLLETIRRAGGDPARAVMVGDSATDAGAARAAGVPLVLVSFGYTETPAAELGADVLIDHFDALTPACARLLRAGERGIGRPSPNGG